MQVAVDVKSIQSDELGIQEELSFSTVGQIYEKKAAYYLQYEEELLDTAAETTTTLKIQREKLTLIRSGGVSMKQEFKVGESSNFKYGTAYGQLNFQLVVDKMEFQTDLEQGEIELEYRLYDGERLINHNRLIIIYEEDLNG